ncbi:MAG: hypothetical protein EGS44_06120 [Akkermansia muciniphila]|nr:hypothetical protein [Akkermansia muciniphila]
MLGLGRTDDGKGVRGEFIRLRGQAVFRHGADEPLDVFRQQVFRVHAFNRAKASRLSLLSRHQETQSSRG